MSPSLTGTSTHWPIWNEPLPSAASFWTVISLSPGQTSTGGPSRSSRPNQPETVSEAEAQRELLLVVAHLEEFAQRVCRGLDDLDWLERREIVRALVRRIEIDHEGVEIVFRIPPPNGPPTPSSGTREDASWQHCTIGSRALVCLGHALSPPRATTSASPKRWPA